MLNWKSPNKNVHFQMLRLISNVNYRTSTNFVIPQYTALTVTSLLPYSRDENMLHEFFTLR